MLTIAAFEFRARLRLISTWAYLALYTLIAGLWMAAAGGAFEHAHVSFGDKIFINSPYPLAMGLTIFGFIGVTIVAAMMGRAVQQDFEHGTFHFFFTAPIRKRDYFFGRFIGAYLTLMLIFVGVAIGFQIGAHWPGVDPAKVAAFSLQSFVRPYLFTLLPNMLWLGGVFFVIAALTRAMAPVYIAGVFVLIGYLLAINLLGDMDNKRLSALIDPIGTTAIDVLTRYWSVADKNTRQVPFEGVLLWNRAIWLGFGLLITAIGYRAFSMDFGSAGTPRSRKAKHKAALVAAATTSPGALAKPALQAALDHSTRAYLRMLPAMIALFLRETVKNPRFYAVVAGGAVFVVGSAKNLGNIYGTNTWPLTYQVLEVTSGFFALFILIITAINAGELVWRERDARIDEIVDSTPVPVWLGFFSKLVTLFVIQGLLLAVVMLCSIGIQLWQGYTKLEIGHYLFELYALQWPRYCVIGALALTIHVLVNQKYLAHFIVVLLFVVLSKLPDFGFEDRLYRFGSLPDIKYSDINGYGHFLPALRWFQLYWGAAAVVLLVAANLLWVRGKDSGLRLRVGIARRRLSASSIGVAAMAALVFAASGGWIFYNTHVLNPFRSQYDLQRLQAEYEQRYKSLEYAPQPKITAIDLKADLFPHRHRAQLGGTLSLVNKTDQPIVDLYVLLPRTADIQSIDFGIPSKLIDSDRDLYWFHYRLDTPLAPGAITACTFDVVYQMHGFTNNGAESVVLDNGTFLGAALGEVSDFVPSFGYAEGGELESDRDRKKFGLAPKERAHDLDDKRWQQQGFARDADWIAYSATISTDADQIATTSGYLDKQWIENGRAYFHYQMDSKMAAIYPIQSGRYAVRKDQWGSGDQAVAIEIDYQPGHEFDLDRMIAGVKDSLDYFTRNFGPYQHKILRIIEFPRYARFAESFPNTVPFSEAIGFTAKVDDQDPKDIDYPYFVTAHEIAHQWWGHQEMPAEVQGGEFITESLAEYSALMVLKHKYGDTKMRRFLRYELDRYLLGRSTESKKEQPLFRADGAAYVHYSKGSLTLYALQDVIGEDAVNQALRAFVERWKFQEPPYPTSRDLLAELGKVTPPDQQSLLNDLFESITLYDNRATQASYRELPDGKFEVDIQVHAKKMHADGSGAETEAPMNDLVDIGVLGEDDKVLQIQKRRVVSGDSSYKLMVDQKPLKAGIDPLNKLIDRIASDNAIAVTKAP
ncbi:MAG: putative rane protein [Nevskia sp.]|nr:putative rane protein [Nevskia sp.]